MMVTPYETLPLRNMTMVQTEQALKQYHIQGRLLPVEDLTENEKFDLLALVEPDENIKTFYQPITIQLPEKKTAIVLDLRPYGRFIQQQNGRVKIASHFEQVSQLIITGLFMGLWRDDPMRVVSYNDILVQCYGSLLAEALGKRLGLDPETTLNVMVTYQIFYATRPHRNIEAITEEEKTSISLALSRKAHVDLNTHKKVFDTMHGYDLKDLSTVTEFISKQGWSPRLNSLSVKDIYNITMHGWIGQGNPKETMMVALEYPPVFNTLVYLCTRSTFYQKLPLGQIVKRLDRGNNLKGFKINTVNLLGTEL